MDLRGMGRGLGGVALGGLCLLASCSGGGSDEGAPGGVVQTFGVNFSVGDVVAEFELAAPDHTPFILHGTMPVPPGMHIPGSVTSPFLVRAQNGATTRAQVEVVTRYPSGAEGSDVVEVLATVQRPGNANPGDRIHYEIVWSPNTPGSMTVDTDVQALLDAPGALVVRSTDVFGHTYEADVLRDLRDNTSELRTLRDGHVAKQVRTYENLVPVTPTAGATGTLPHMMGVHSFVTIWDAEPFFSLDVRFHNGHEGFDPGTDQDDPVGKLYFNELELVMPAGWSAYQAYESPDLGTQYLENPNQVFPIVAPIGGGELHMMPIQARFARRLIVVRDGSEARARSVLAEAGLGFCRDGENDNEERLLSWWNPGSARYWGQNLPLPALGYLKTKNAFRTQMEDDFNELHGVITNGTTGPWPIVSEDLGWAHPWGGSGGGAVSGSEIVFWDGLEATWSASNEGYRSFQISHRMYVERHPTALYALNGEPYQLEKWLVDGPNRTYLPTWLFTIPWFPLGDPHGFTTAPTFQIDAVANQGRQPAYEGALLGFNAVDSAHQIRYTRSAKVLAWVGNDALAKDDLRLQAELMRGSYTRYPQADNGQVISTGMAADLAHIDAHPGDGMSIDRAEGWSVDTVSCYYAMADPAWRATALPWFKDFTDQMVAGQSTCNGYLMALPHSDHLGGQYRLVQSISEAILENGLWSARTSVFDREDDTYAARVSSVIKTSTDAMISWKTWNAGGSTFHFYTALGLFDVNQPTYCSYVPNDGHSGQDNWQTWNTLVFGYLLSGNQDYLTKAALMGGGTLTDTAIGQDTWTGELEVRAGMIGLVQSMQP